MPIFREGLGSIVSARSANESPRIHPNWNVRAKICRRDLVACLTMGDISTFVMASTISLCRGALHLRHPSKPSVMIYNPLLRIVS
ncbi:hypothetical protein KC345_g44 [Hortaea werneckii]|nr:hypothetical protein KC345_g44 [Hortaea werneckii]